MLKYTFDDKMIELSESPNENDFEFRIRLVGDTQQLKQRLQAVQRDFENNDLVTDVLSYLYLNGEYRIIVRHDFYVDFILAMMKHRLLLSVAWE
ncbi:hypothetical protein CBW46_017705 [Paenibacillus xerothermodurans]|uniref:Uncharacterized protein n=2 Tax=Paenibacillus xerothermodurans TaxID=1977292 RepID=A0A2W1NP85_PAEXE|nr:hypothetical protein CBW46_017705 [Paenibacillus xerothermodurans]